MENIDIEIEHIPKYVLVILEKLNKAGFESYIVGGCVRDLIMERAPSDWDVTTNALPDEILKVFSDAKYDNVYGTVLVPTGQTKDKRQQTKEKRIVEVTTYRSEQGYNDRRHPDEIKFEKELDKDLERRDFTINAIALRQTTDDRRQRL